MSCADLAQTTEVAGQTIQITEEQTASASPGSPEYCAVTGHINTTIGFEILLPTSTWRQRYLKVGRGGLCGSISINPAETAGCQPLADGDFVLAAEDDGHSGQSTTWSTSALQRVQFAYLSYHDVALVSKGLAQIFYGMQPRYSYFDGCSQGGHEALGEVQRYPTDFNGVLAGAPASIMTELTRSCTSTPTPPTTAGSITRGARSSTNGGEHRPERGDEGLLPDGRADARLPLVRAEVRSRLDRVLGDVDEQLPDRRADRGRPQDLERAGGSAGPASDPGGYSLGSEFNWSSGTSANLPLTPGGTVTPASFITACAVLRVWDPRARDRHRPDGRHG